MFSKSKKTLYGLLILFLTTAFILSVALGAVRVPIGESIRILINGITQHSFFEVDKSYESIIFSVRLPRVIIAILVGAALAISGTAIQSLFRNPMADPGVIGISSGASFGAIIVIALGLSSVSLYFTPIFASLGALLIAYVIYRLSCRDRSVSMLTMILSGMAVSTFIRGMIAFILTGLNNDQMKDYMFWSVGSLADRRGEHVFLIIVPILLGMILLCLRASDLNILLLGDEDAHSVGLNPGKSRKIILFLSALTTAMAVSVSGSISFVGLIVPHMMRLLVGADNRILLPVSAFAGAIFLLLSDLLARLIFAPSEISVGVVTSILGAPYFLYLLNKSRKDGIAL